MYDLKPHTMINSGGIEDFGTLLRLLMIQANVTQADLARHLGVRRPTVSDWANGEHLPRHRDLILEAAQFLGASEEETQQLLTAAIMPHHSLGVAARSSLSTPSDTATIGRLRQKYVEQIAAYAQTLPLTCGQIGDMQQAHIHSRLEPLNPTTWPPEDRATSGNTPEKSRLADSLYWQHHVMW